MHSFGVAHVLDEPWQPPRYVGECVVACKIHLLDLERLHEALGLCIISSPWTDVIFVNDTIWIAIAANSQSTTANLAIA